eukprot:NODE_225_length_1860_cov_93.426428_g200_i0.p1 GENE.NODE_225_length_1860_cov_93.426428_g200_i0~~NODE_225_length_1860_cov_93.426428_g200_i0.p1  ORF type:complete len:299 (-),score=53.00 NODE_225_length_1860_cov_93.426428_g200_i0:84-980(-)
MLPTSKSNKLKNTMIVPSIELSAPHNDPFSSNLLRSPDLPYSLDDPYLSADPYNPSPSSAPCAPNDYFKFNPTPPIKDPTATHNCSPHATGRKTSWGPFLDAVTTPLDETLSTFYEDTTPSPASHLTTKQAQLAPARVPSRRLSQAQDQDTPLPTPPLDSPIIPAIKPATGSISQDSDKFDSNEIDNVKKVNTQKPARSQPKNNHRKASSATKQQQVSSVVPTTHASGAPITKRERNRLAAMRYRQRARDLIEQLTEEVKVLEGENRKYATQAATLESEVAYLRNLLGAATGLQTQHA